MSGDLMDLVHWQPELADNLQALSRTCDGISTAIEGMSISKTCSGGGRGQPHNQAGLQVHEKFKLDSGVPVRTGAKAKASAKGYTKKRSSSRVSTISLTSKPGTRLLDDWSEAFVVSEQEATNIYNELYGERASEGERAFSSIQSMREFSAQCCQRKRFRKTLLAMWELMTLSLVLVDTVLTPFTLAWPSSRSTPFRSTTFFQVSPWIWSLDILMSFAPAIVASPCSQKLLLAKKYVGSAFPLDVCLLAVDILILFGIQDEGMRLLVLLRLMRFLKMQRVITTFEYKLAERGSTKVVSCLVILQCVATILIVNHILACLLFYVGHLGKIWNRKNWIEFYEVLEQTQYSQYMTCFNWVIAEYTPAPFPYKPQNEIEQTFIIVIILTCLPLLGSQIGKISGTLNLMKEKARERDMVRRELQRWLQKREAPGRLMRRMLASLDNVLDSRESPLEIKEPMALKFLPHSLLEELRIVKMSQKLGMHPLLHMLMDDRLAISGRLSTSFRDVNAVQGDAVFTSGRRGEGLYITQSGQFVLHTDPLQDLLAQSVHKKSSTHSSGTGALIQEETWLAELCLYTNLNHISTLTCTVYSKVLTTPVAEFIQAVRTSPAAVVAVHEYAVRLLTTFQPHKVPCWERLSPKDADDCVSHTQLAELLKPGSGQIHNLRSSEETDFTTFLDVIMADGLSNNDLVNMFQKFIPELRGDGIYAQLHIQDEAKRALLSLLSTVWFLKDDYDSMVEAQKPGQRLSKVTFQAIEETLGGRQMSKEQLTALVVLLALRGLGKSSDFAKLCPPSERRTPEQVLAYALANLDGYLPSVASLQGEVYHQIVALVRMLSDFNFAQMLQGENNPHSVWQLQCAREDEGEDVYRTFLFVQVSILCGVTGSMSLAGSMFLTEANGRSVMKGLACLHDLTGVDPAAVYWNYISSRAEALDLHVATPSHLVLARLACLTRTVQASSLQALANGWEELTNQEKDALLELFLSDGHDDKAFILLYLPLFLANATANPDLGLRHGLQFLVDLYTKLMAHRCLNQEASTVTVDISSLASAAKNVDGARLLRLCLDCSRIVKHGTGVTVLLTAESYQFMSGQLVDEDRKLQMLELVAAQQRRLEDALMGRRQSMLVKEVSLRPDTVLSDVF